MLHIVLKLAAFNSELSADPEQNDRVCIFHVKIRAKSSIVNPSRVASQINYRHPIGGEACMRVDEGAFDCGPYPLHSVREAASKCFWRLEGVITPDATSSGNELDAHCPGGLAVGLQSLID